MHKDGAPSNRIINSGGWGHMVVDIEVLIWRKYGILLDKTLLKAVWPEAGYRNL